MRRFHTWVLSHNLPSSGSTGQVCPGRYIIHADSASMMAEPAKTHTLCWLSVIRKGNVLVRAATVAPMPRVTSMMGNAQQTSVPVDANKVTQVAPVSERGVPGFTAGLSDRCIFLFGHSHSFLPSDGINSGRNLF